MIDLEKPIMVIYVNVSALSTKRAEEYISNIVESFKFDDINTITFPTSGREGIEIIWKGRDIEKSDDDVYIIRLQNFLNSILELFDDPKNVVQGIKREIRNFNIESIGI